MYEFFCEIPPHILRAPQKFSFVCWSVFADKKPVFCKISNELRTYTKELSRRKHENKIIPCKTSYFVLSNVYCLFSFISEQCQNTFSVCNFELNYLPNWNEKQTNRTNRCFNLITKELFLSGIWNVRCAHYKRVRHTDGRLFNCCWLVSTN